MLNVKHDAAAQATSPPSGTNQLRRTCATKRRIHGPNSTPLVSNWMPARILRPALRVVERLVLDVALQVPAARRRARRSPAFGDLDRAAAGRGRPPAAAPPASAARRGLGRAASGVSSPRARSAASASVRSAELPRENGNGFSGWRDTSGDCAPGDRGRSSSGRGGGVGAGMSTRGCTKTNRCRLRSCFLLPLAPRAGAAPAPRGWAGTARAARRRG